VEEQVVHWNQAVPRTAPLLEVQQVPEFEVQQVLEFAVQQVREFEVQQVREFEVQQVPELEVQQVPELEVQQVPELGVQQVPELEVQQVLSFVSELPPADWLGQEWERSPSSREAEAAPPVGCFGATNHEPAARELRRIRRADSPLVAA